MNVYRLKVTIDTKGPLVQKVIPLVIVAPNRQEVFNYIGNLYSCSSTSSLDCIEVLDVSDCIIL